jgi:hypothetical protein
MAVGSQLYWPVAMSAAAQGPRVLQKLSNHIAFCDERAGAAASNCSNERGNHEHLELERRLVSAGEKLTYRARLVPSGSPRGLLDARFRGASQFTI